MASSPGSQVSALRLSQRGRKLRFTAVLENPDPEKPEAWTFQILNTWKDDRDPHQITQPEMLAELKHMTAKIADPFKSAIQWIPEGTPVPLTRLYSWEPVPWDNRGGRITLAGDAAHTMTFRKQTHRLRLPTH